MKIPPKVERHRLDLDWPDLFPALDTANGGSGTPSTSNSPTQQMPSQGYNSSNNTPTAFGRKSLVEKVKHTAGPMLDLTLVDKFSSRADYEAMVMRHFQVFDNTI